MALQQLEHFLIQTTDIRGTRDWYVNLLGLREGPAPEFNFPVCWLYLGDTPVLHLAEGGPGAPENRMAYLGQESTETQGSGVIDHVAFNASDASAMLAVLERSRVSLNTRRISETGMLQVFVFDPNGVKVELNFAAGESAGIEADVNTGDLPPG